MKNGCILCGGVGSGKSLTALAYYYLQNGGDQTVLSGKDYVPMPDPPKNLYIITTARKRDELEWESEMAPFLMSTKPGIGLYSNKIVVDSWNNIKKYTDVTGAFFIFDEQRVVGSGAWVKSFLQITKTNEWVLLSATPGDTWQDYIPVFVANGFYKNRTEFVRDHIIYRPFKRYLQIDRYISTGRLIKFRDSILVTMDYTHPTISHHEDVYVSYNQATYKELVRTRWDIWNDKPIEDANGYCHALRRIVNTDMSRQVALYQILEDHPRAIVFYNFDYELDILRRLVLGDEYTIAEWNGHIHEPLPDTDKWVYLVQYNAGAEGWNCVKTDTVVFFSQNYSYKTLVQASGRIDRLNTLYTDLYYYHLKSRSGIDLAIDKALKNKKNFNENRFMRVK